MKKQLLSLSLALLGGLASCSSPQTEPVVIIPQPHSITTTDGAFVIDSSTEIGFSDPSLAAAANYLAGILNRNTSLGVKTVGGAGDISLELDTTMEPNGYTLVAEGSSVKIKGADYNGVINGISSLRQLLPWQIDSKEDAKNIKTWAIPTLTINDAPKYQWRGLMLDVSRHFYSKEEIKELLDLMALYKLNKFHWHLTDDQGWRVEIKKYPLLTENGAWREFNNHDKGCIESAGKDHNPDMALPKDKLKQVDGKTLYGGFYTQDDIREIVAYGLERGIDIMPEIDMPGHFLVAMENYDDVSCFGETGWGAMFSSPVCPGKESALEFCKNIYAEIFELFPYEYVHLGADEVEKTNWERCPDCQARIKEYDLKDEHELQSWFVKYMEKFFNENGKKLVGWDEILEGGLSETATITWWRNWVPNSVPDATAQGNEAILSPNVWFYFDYAQDNNTLQKLYEVELLKDLPSEQQKLIKGVQGNVWCEWIPSRERMHYMVFPRALGVAEQGWGATGTWDDFKSRVYAQNPRLDALDVTYWTPELNNMKQTVVFSDTCKVEFITEHQGANIRYTTDGSEPTINSTLYSGPFVIDSSTDIKVAIFHKRGRRGTLFSVNYIKQQPFAAQTPANVKDGLKAAWHDYKGETCLELEKAKLNKTFITDGVVIPAGAKGNIGLAFTGYIDVPADDIYTFVLTSDDGSMLWVNDLEVIDNDGGHSPRELSGQISLQKGKHKIKALYFDHNGGMLNMVVKDSKGNDVTQKYFH